MSVIKRPYEISVWKDILTNSSGGTTPSSPTVIDYTNENLAEPQDTDYQNGLFLKEEKIAIIGSNTMDSQNAVCEPQLNLDTKGQTTLNFSIYRRYYDNKTGELVDNPFYQYIQNEQKIKLYYDDGISDDKWRDFIITSVSPETEEYKTSVIATDLASTELSKIGFNKTFNSELQNNTDTINNLARNALQGTVWEVDDENTEEIKQFQVDNLVRLKVKQNVYFYLYSNDNHTVDSTYRAYIAANNYVYGFYSELSQPIENIKDIHIIFLVDTISKDTTNHRYDITTREATNIDFIDNVLQNDYFAAADVYKFGPPNWATYKNVNIPDTYFKVSNHTFSDDIVINFLRKGNKLVQNQLTKYDPILNRYVKKYNKENDINEYYGYEDSEYIVEPLVQNLITNGEDQIVLDGWLIGEDESFRSTQVKLSQTINNLLANEQRKNYINKAIIEYKTEGSGTPRLNNRASIYTRTVTYKNVPGYGYTQTCPLSRKYCRFEDFIINTGFQDNINIINNLQLQNKFRIQLDFEGDHSSLQSLCGLHSYIVKLPEKVSVSDVIDDPSLIGVEQSTLIYNDTPIGRIFYNIPILIDFSYIPEQYKMFDVDYGWYYKHDTRKETIQNKEHTYEDFTFKNNLAIYAQGGLVPIRLGNLNTSTIDYSAPIFYCPYWRIRDLYTSGLITSKDDNSSNVSGYDKTFHRETDSTTGGTWNKTYDVFPIYKNVNGVNKPCPIMLTQKGVDHLRSYLQGTDSDFLPIDFCIFCNIYDFFYWENTSDTLNINGNNINVYVKINAEQDCLAKKNTNYFVMFTNYVSDNIQYFLDSTLFHIGADSWANWIEDSFKNRETYKYVYNSNDTPYYIRGYFSSFSQYQQIFVEKENLNGTITVIKEQDGAEIEETIEWDGVYKTSEYGTDNDIDTLLRIRNAWKIIHYEPFDTFTRNDTDYKILHPYCTVETEGTYTGIRKQVNNYIISSQIGSKTYTTMDFLTVDKDRINFTHDELADQENIILFSRFGAAQSELQRTVSTRDFYTYSVSNVLLTRFYKDSNGNIVTPDTIPSASTRTIYKYYNSTYGRSSVSDVENEKDILYDSIGYTTDSDFIPKMNMDGLAYNSITATESNILNILQNLCEIFNCWLKISLKHRSNGEIDYDEGTFKPKGKISFHKYIGDNLPYGFVKGVNLESINRTDVSDEIVTKMIVKQNSNEFGQDKLCTISRSIFNHLGGNEMYNFDYYINQNILKNDVYDILKTYYGDPLNRIKKRTLELQEELKQLAVQVTQIQAKQDYYKEQYSAATGEITTYKNLFEDLTGIPYSEYLNNPTDTDRDWSQNGLISLYKEYKTKIKYYNNVQTQAYEKWQIFTKQYDEVYAEYKKKSSLINTLAAHREKIMKEFYNIYHSYIHEGSWISEDYIDDDKYYFAATDVLNTSAQPKVTYTFNVVDVGALDEFQGYNFKLGDKTFVEDPEFFGYQTDGVTPYREEVTISGMQINLDSPEKNTITVQNYRTQFQDLFQRIAATVQAVEYHTGNYRNTKTEQL